MDVRHFRNADEFRRWLQKHHDTVKELWIGFYRKGCGKTGMSYPEAVDQALCFGWIDGIRKRVDDISYTNRFSPRTAKSGWSRINIQRMAELTKLGMVAEPGRAAFKARDPKQSQMFTLENHPSFPPELEKIFKAQKAAWAFWETMPPGRRRMITWWVISAVKDETRRSRLAVVMDKAARRQPMGLMTPSAKKTKGRSRA